MLFDSLYSIPILHLSQLVSVVEMLSQQIWQQNDGSTKPTPEIGGALLYYKG